MVSRTPSIPNNYQANGTTAFQLLASLSRSRCNMETSPTSPKPALPCIRTGNSPASSNSIYLEHCFNNTTDIEEQCHSIESAIKRYFRHLHFKGGKVIELCAITLEMLDPLRKAMIVMRRSPLSNPCMNRSTPSGEGD